MSTINRLPRPSNATPASETPAATAALAAALAAKPPESTLLDDEIVGERVLVNEEELVAVDCWLLVPGGVARGEGPVGERERVGVAVPDGEPVHVDEPEGVPVTEVDRVDVMEPVVVGVLVAGVELGVADGEGVGGYTHTLEAIVAQPGPAQL